MLQFFLRELEVSLIELLHFSGIAFMEHLKNRKGAPATSQPLLTSFRGSLEGTRWDRRNAKQAWLVVVRRGGGRGVLLGIDPTLLLDSFPQVPQGLSLMWRSTAGTPSSREKLVDLALGERTGLWVGSRVKKVTGRSDSAKGQSFSSSVNIQQA